MINIVVLLHAQLRIFYENWLKNKTKQKEKKRRQNKTRHDCVIAMTRTLPAYDLR